MGWGGPIQPSIQIDDERVTLTGNGVDGLGAIYTDDSTDNKTRLVNGDGSEEMIILDGDAPIRVGNADGQITPDDYLVWSNNFGATAPVSSAAVPEPAALLLAALACAAVGPPRAIQR